MTRFALVRIPDDTSPPDGLVGWYETRPARQYAYVADPAAWARWVVNNYPDRACVHIDAGFERTVRDGYAKAGEWLLPTGELVQPSGLKLGTDGQVRLHVSVTADGSIEAWESPVDVDRIPA